MKFNGFSFWFFVQVFFPSSLVVDPVINFSCVIASKSGIASSSCSISLLVCALFCLRCLSCLSSLPLHFDRTSLVFVLCVDFVWNCCCCLWLLLFFFGCFFGFVCCILFGCGFLPHSVFFFV